MDTASPRVLLISGSSGAGKSTLSRLVAERFPLGVCIDGDLITGLIVAGGRPPRIEAWSSESNSFDPETDRQLNLRFRVLGRMARTYLESGFSVVIDSFFAEPWVWRCLDELEGCETHLVTIEVPRRVRYDRIRARGTASPVEAFDQLVDAALDAQPKDRGLWLDGSRMRPSEMADVVLGSLDSSRLRSGP